MADEETVIVPRGVARPNPGGRRSPVPPPKAPAPLNWDMVRAESRNPVVAAALPLLDLAIRLRGLPTNSQIEQLRSNILREIDTFEHWLGTAGVAPRTIRASIYAVCATIDDLVLNTPWGSRSLWTSRSLVSSVFSETWGGDRFFDLLTQLKKEPGVNCDLLELLYFCISLGFEGKYRVSPRGQSELARLREDLYRLIRTARGQVERDLAPHWEGVVKPYHWIRDDIPAWLVAVVVALLLLFVYGLLAFFLNAQSDKLFAQLAALPPSEAVSVNRTGPPPPPALQRSAELRRFLEPEIRAGLVRVDEDAQTITVFIRGETMFNSGSALVKPSFDSLMDRIGIALNDQAGNVLVVGHTDNTPIHSLAFPSNWHLSVARAQNVGALLRAKMRDSSRLTEEGRGDTQPVASNDSEAGREKNRRIEITITKAG